jgi:hypothetical protein
MRRAIALLSRFPLMALDLISALIITNTQSSGGRYDHAGVACLWQALRSSLL